jgi:hypothetical protein
MAIVFRIADEAQAVNYDFQTGNLKAQTMTRTPNGDGWLTTSMTLVARASETNTLLAVQSIDELAEKCDLFWDDTHVTASIWLEESASSETAKRSLIKSIELTPLQVGWFSTLLGKQAMFYQLTIIHSAAWEKHEATLLDTANVNCLGGTAYIAPIDGSLPARINLMGLIGDATSGDILTTFWGGIKPDYGAAGTSDVGSTDFSPLVQLELGTLVAPAVLASDSDNASPVGTTDNVVSYATTTGDVKIIYETLDNAFTSTVFNNWTGNYLVLLRARLDTAQVVRLHVDTGYLGGSVFIPGPYVYTSSTDYTLMEMGTISMPPFSRQNASHDLLETFEFQLYAMRIGTAVTLIADCLILIPADHMFKLTNALLDHANTSLCYSYINVDGTVSTINNGTDGKINMAAQLANNNFVCPIAGGTFVIAGQRSALQTVTDEVALNIEYCERYRTHGE